MFVCLFIVIVFLMYGVIPTVMIRSFSLRIYKKGMNGIALTFDDGPDPIYTPQLLDLLKKHHVKATFFVVGSKAKKYPHIIKRIDEEGHAIGLHHYHHISNWILLPFFVEWELKKTADVIEEITGKRPVLYRPPWGHFNLFTLFTQKRYKTVMWTYILGDWKASLGANRLYERLKNCRKDGAIIVLHDSGSTLGADEEAPKYMLKALERFLKENNDIRWTSADEW
ncbi:polysaccharide deacetylase [Thermolongibacillus altinsuensis]|uniref:Polysaccharide deacetylase n=2 Tax=Thermolongibacillus altinsuensis TaxID=575256 RepID=A0A4V6NGF7_9BACL|nr:polysaccharide deacetylase [Thermolongibacillus altinsuensis]